MTGLSRSRRRLIPLLTLLLGLGGCAGGGWGARNGLPDSWQAVGAAVRQAAAQPGVWAPLAGAVVIGVTDLDDNVSDWAVRKQPLFGSNASQVSDDLLDASLVVWGLSAALAPADSLGDKVLGVASQAGTIYVTGGVTEGLKQLTSRQRPNGENNKSLPSGHASQAAVRTHLARTNLSYIELPDGVRLASDIALHSLGYATAWARVEANRHYPSDVLAGIALGNFFAEFFRGAFFEARPDAATMRFRSCPMARYCIFRVACASGAPGARPGAGCGVSGGQMTDGIANLISALVLRAVQRHIRFSEKPFDAVYLIDGCNADT